MMFGMPAGYVFLTLAATLWALVSICQVWAGAWQRRGVEREKTRQLEAKAQIRRAEADVKMVTSWQSPKIEG
jgi:heme exporter protein D